MIKIAVCDDRCSDLQRLMDMVNDYASLHPEYEIVPHAYRSPSVLLSHVEGGAQFQIYLLDILMPSLSGIDLGLGIRKYDDDCFIIFCTITPEYALESYGVRAQHYLLKPYRGKELFQVLDRTLFQIEQRQDTGFHIRTQSGHIFLPFHQIVYIELVQRRMVFHMLSRETIQSTILRGSFESALAELLADPRFLQPHKSFVVNMDHVQLSAGFHLTLRDRTAIPISFRKHSEVLNRLFSYVRTQKK